MKIRELTEWGRIVKGVNTTADVDTNSISREAGKFGNKVDKDGRPPTLSKKVKGSKTNVLFNLGLSESVKMKFQRGEDFDTLHIQPKNKNRVELRGKPGYERGNYDAQDKLHQVLDSLGKAANFAELMNGEVVTINPKHPDGERAKNTVQDVLSTEGWSKKYKDSINCSNPKGFSQKAHCAGRKKNEAQELSSVSTIYVDMDGVLADFFGDWAKLMGKDHWTKIDDISPALQKIRDTENFWLDLPLTDNAKNLLALIKDVKGEYNILSSPLPDDPNSEPHKREWITKNLNFFLPKEVIITHDKAKYATTEDGTPNILIDDYGQNIAKWEAAGGIGFKHKDHKFERTAKAIKQHMQEPVSEGELLDKPTPSIDQLAKRHGVDRSHIIDQVKMGIKAELEHTSKKDVALEIALDHVLEDPNYYTNLKFIENFADGKKKGKSRPGRVKRSGASCKGSVTSLRKKAKKYSGERGRMYHWCANMKSGRNK
jgi:5'(3')-deoxyribonucleotidase